MTQIINRINVCADPARLNYMSSQCKVFFLTLASIKGHNKIFFILTHTFFAQLIKLLFRFFFSRTLLTLQPLLDDAGIS